MMVSTALMVALASIAVVAAAALHIATSGAGAAQLLGENKDCFDDGAGAGGSPLMPGAYDAVCPQAESIILSGVLRAVSGDPRMAASLLRLHFHDCFVLGCDASVLLDDTTAATGEKTAGPNLNSLRGFDVVDDIKSELEVECPAAVSCADILAVAARDSVVISGGPTWQVELGRFDALTASLDGANNNIPGPNSTLAVLVSKFAAFGLGPKDLVALSGGHTIGNARCATFAGRLTGGGGGGEFLQSLQELCTAGGSSTLAALDAATPTAFDGSYYLNLISGEGLLPSDQALIAGDEDDAAEIVEGYAADEAAFFDDFAAAMLKMGRIGVITSGAGGEIRRSCRAVNN